MRLALLLRRGLELNEVIDAKDRDRSFRREPHGETPRSGKGVQRVQTVQTVQIRARTLYIGQAMCMHGKKLHIYIQILYLGESLQKVYLCGMLIL